MEEKIFFNPEERDYKSEILSLITGDLQDTELREALEEYHDNDIASAVEELEPSSADKLFRALGAEAMSEVVTFLDDAGEYLSALESDDAADIIEQMDADDALEALEDLDEDKRSEVLELIEDEEVREDIALIDSYDDDEFGSMMSTNFISVSREQTVKSAMRSLIDQAAENDNIHTLFVVDNDGVFCGAVGLKELIVARGGDDFGELICSTFPFVLDKDIISENIERLRSYSEELIPVLQENSGKLLGVITSADIIEMIDDELGEDYAKLAALGSEEGHDESLFASIKKRVPWLITLLFLGLAVSAVVGLFGKVVDELPMIVAFQSLILGMAGNVGTQSLAVTVRGLGADELSIKQQFSIIGKETKIALLNGFVMGAVAFIIVSIYLLVFASYQLSFVLSCACCVGAAMCFSMMLSGFTGAAIPMCLYRFGFDPAVASGPLITTFNDLSAVVSYYTLAWLLLLNL